MWVLDMVDASVAPERRDFYVYVLLREDGTPFYVGKGRGQRCMAHVGQSKTEQTPKARIIRRMIRAGFDVPVVKLAEGLTEAEAFARERDEIARIGRRPNGPLWNLTDGGEGAWGYKKSKAACEAQKARVTALWTDPDYRNRVVSAMVASKNSWSAEKRALFKEKLKTACRSPKVRAERSARMVTLWQDPERRTAFRAAFRASFDDARREERRQKNFEMWTTERRADLAEVNVARWACPEFKAKTSAAIRAAKSAPERRVAQSRRNVAMWANDEVKDRQRASLKKALSNPDLREQLSAIRKARWADPEFRQKMLAAQRAAAAKKAAEFNRPPTDRMAPKGATLGLIGPYVQGDLFG